MNQRTYPRFPEYVLLDLIPEEQTYYKRGAKESYIYHEEFEKWHTYFCSPNYILPEGKDIAFFQVCTWSKPYDFSYIGKKVRSVTSEYSRIHPIILSNAGVIPYEYQMNPTFCAYDWIADEQQSNEQLTEIREQYQDATLMRIENYLTAKKDRYSAVVHYCLPTKQSLAQHVYQICKKLEIPYYLAPTVDTYRKVKDEFMNLKDPGDFYALDEVLSDLDYILGKVNKDVGYCNRDTCL